MQHGEGTLYEFDLEIGKRWVDQKSTMLGPNAGENIETKMNEE